MGVLVLSEFVVAAITNNIMTNNMATMDNHPPNAPWIEGPQYIRPWKTYEWKFTAIDPDGDNVSYQIAWGDSTGDDWFGWYASGEEITRSHYYPCYGRFAILARAKDTHNATGEWGAILDVRVPRNYHMTNSLILKCFSQFMKLYIRGKK